MKKSWLMGLASFALATAQLCHAAPAETPEISQIVVTSFTGTDASHPKAKVIDRVLLKSDGSAVYVGSNTYAKRTGRYRGTVDNRDFLRLANLFQQNGFPNTTSSYNKYTGPDYAGREVAVVKYDITFGGQRKTISVYEDSGPKFIQNAGKISRGLLWKIPWQKVSSSDSISSKSK